MTVVRPCSVCGTTKPGLNHPYLILMGAGDKLTLRQRGPTWWRRGAERRHRRAMRRYPSWNHGIELGHIL